MNLSIAAFVIALASAMAQGPAVAQGAAPAAASVPTAARLFAVEIKVGPNWDAARPAGEQAHFRDHSAHLKRLRDAGRIVVGARYGDNGLLIMSAATIDEVEAAMNADPSMSAGTFSYQVWPLAVFYPGAVAAEPRR